jgi:ornithine carbamoyltransferase
VLREEKRFRTERQQMKGRNIALIFEKTSTRTRSAFEVGAHDQGAHVTYLGPEESPFGHKESMKDTARVLGRMFDGIEYRGFAHETVETLAQYAGVPVWNGLTDEWHPTQMLADILTVRTTRPSRWSRSPSATSVTPATTRRTRSWSPARLLGMDIRLAGPPAACGRRRGPGAPSAGGGLGARISVGADAASGRRLAPTSSTPTSGSRWASRRRRGASGSTSSSPTR